MKECNTCKDSKDESEFYKSKRGKEGLNPVCKKCIKKRTLCTINLEFRDCVVCGARFKQKRKKTVTCEDKKCYLEHYNNKEEYTGEKYDHDDEHVNVFAWDGVG